MQHALSALRNRLDSWLLIGLFGAAFLISQLVIGVIVAPLGPSMLMAQLTLSAAQVRELFALWESAGVLGAYAAHYRFDLLHPLWYSLFLGALLAKAFNAYRMPATWNFVLLMPFAAGALDILENLVHLSFLADRANITQAAVLIGNGAAILKWLLALSSFSSAAILALKAARQR